MSLVDDLKSGFTPGAFNNAPFIPGSTWYAKLPLNTASIVGLTLFGYVESGEFTGEKLFDIDITNAVENTFVFAYLTADNGDTEELRGCNEAFVTFGFTEDSTSNSHVLYRGLIPTQAGVV